MKITELRITNFRSFGKHETLINLNKLTAIIGSNSTGKTAMIHALLKIFGSTQKDRMLERSDFHVPQNQKPEEMKQDLELIIEVKLEFPELKGQGDGTKTVPSFFQHMVTGHPGEIPYIRIRLKAKWSEGNTPEGEIDSKLSYVTVPYGEAESEDSLKPMAIHERALIQMIYVPAVREPSSQLKNASGTILWRLFKNISWPEDTDGKVQEKLEPLNDLFDGIAGLREVRETIQDEWKKYHFDFRYSKAEFSFNNTTLETILKKMEVQFSPTEDVTNYTIDKLGDGLRSLFYLSLVSALLEVENKVSHGNNEEFVRKDNPTALTILAVEEPENHIAPHLLGRVTKNLHQIAVKDNAQVLISSHSSSIVKRVEPEEIRHTRIGKTGNKKGSTIVSEVKLPPDNDQAHKYVKEAVKAYPELYFAELVILGEGDSEEIIIPKLLESEDIFPDNEMISIVPLGGRYVNHFWRLLKQLDIPYITLLDLDRERGGGGWGRIKYALKQLIEIGANKKELLAKKNGVLTDRELDDMHKRGMDNEVSLKNMEFWLRRLKSFNVFFSSPLDIDFLMLESYPDEYKFIPENGPSIPDKDEDPDGYLEAVENGVNATLKKKKGDTGHGFTFSDKQKELMIWYNTLFLGRSKPSTHIEALAKIGLDKLKTRCPQELKLILNAVKEVINRDIV